MIQKTKANAFLRDEQGGITVLNVYFTIVMCILAGIAIDMSMLTKTRTQLQVAADAAAHAALTTRELNDFQTSVDAAMDIANANMPAASYGVGLEEGDIMFGTYDKASRTFTVDQTSRDAVYVMTERAAADSNPVSSFLLKFAGFDEWDVRTSSVYETYIPICFREGFVAEEFIDLQSGNGFSDGFCVHSNSHIEVNNGNNFQDGVIVSMPNQEDIVRPTNDTGNTGLDKALRSYKYDIKILNRLQEIEDNLTTPGHRYYRDWLTTKTVKKITEPKNQVKMTMADFTEGQIHDVNCTAANPTLTLNGPFQNVGIITNCPIVFGNGVVLVDATIITHDESNASWSTPNGLVLGKDDKCAAGGSVQLLSWGSVDSASGLEIYGSQIIVAGNISFTSNAIGQGAAVVAGGTIDTTSGITMAYCGANMGENFTAEYFRLAG
jgi:Flp pilus assembly protein TadG